MKISLPQKRTTCIPRGNGRFRVVSTWNTHCVFVRYNPFKACNSAKVLSLSNVLPNISELLFCRTPWSISLLTRGVFRILPNISDRVFLRKTPTTESL